MVVLLNFILDMKFHGHVSCHRSKFLGEKYILVLHWPTVADAVILIYVVSKLKIYIML